MKKSIFILFFLFSLFLYSKNRETELDSLFPKISEKVDSIEELIPKGWECLQKVEGDLNKDKLDDVAIILTKNDPKNIRTCNIVGFYHMDLGETKLDFNPLVLIVLFKEKNGKYTVVSKNTKNRMEFFCSTEDDIPTEEDLNDMLLRIGDTNPSYKIWIKNNTLHISFSTVSLDFVDPKNEYIFRYQNKNFELIGAERTMIYYKGLYSVYSINLSTGKRKTVEFDINYEDESRENRKDFIKEVKWEKIKSPKLTLEDINFGTSIHTLESLPGLEFWNNFR